MNSYFKRPQEIIVFVVGGITYEETSAIFNINKAYAGNIKVVIGGTYLHNFKSFVQEVNSLVGQASSTVSETNRYARGDYKHK